MSRTITLDVPEPLFDLVADAARVRGMAPADWIVDQIGEQLEALPRKDQVEVSDYAESLSPSEAEDRLIRMFGSVDTGDPNSADNDRIDADLAREYGAGLDWKD